MPPEGSNAFEAMEHQYAQELASVEQDGLRTLIKSYFGTIDEPFTYSICEEIETQLMGAGEKKGNVRRLISIMIEALQNTRLHGQRNADGKAVLGLVLDRTDSKFNFHFMNVCSEGQGMDVQVRVNELNAMEPAELKSHYMDVMTNGELSEKGGAGLGLITMVMKSKNKVGLEMSCRDTDSCLLATRVYVDRA